MLSILLQESGASEAVSELAFLDYVNLGVLGILVVAFIRGWVVPKYVLDRQVEELEKRETELTELRTRLDREVLPQLWRTTDLLAQFANREKPPS